MWEREARQAAASFQSAQSSVLSSLSWAQIKQNFEQLNERQSVQDISYIEYYNPACNW